jgi:Holliday junction DNA helicase RuvA
LLTVTGCGPKVALALLGQVGEESIIHAVLAQDPKTLTRATGVGTKLGERIILELREKMHKESLALKIDRSKSASDDLVDALLALGYRRQEAETAAETARAAGGTIEAQIRAALQNLRR